MRKQTRRTINQDEDAQMMWHSWNPLLEETVSSSVAVYNSSKSAVPWHISEL